MKEFLTQTGTQLAIIGLIWVLITRNATKFRDKNGSAPANISPFDWGALCGLTFIALIPYFYLRSKKATAKATPDTPHLKERSLLKVWIVLSVAASVWAYSQLTHHDNNNAAQHFLLAAIFLGCGLYGWYRNRRQAG